jgi:lipoate-protein ligase A
LASSGSLFDVEQFRTRAERVAVVREVSGPTLVLGSTQSAALVDAAAVGARGVEVERRRGGGGAVYLAPAEQLWLDAWVPRDDPLWVTDVSVAAEWVGAWWKAALAAVGVDGRGLEVHTGRSVPGEYGDQVCFAGRGPGEVFRDGRKVVGLSQWRAREGALFSSCAYAHWDPASLLALLDVGSDERRTMAAGLAAAATGLTDQEPQGDRLGRVQAELLRSLPAFTLTGPPVA